MNSEIPYNAMIFPTTRAILRQRRECAFSRCPEARRCKAQGKNSAGFLTVLKRYTLGVGGPVVLEKLQAYALRFEHIKPVHVFQI